MNFRHIFYVRSHIQMQVIVPLNDQHSHM